MAAKFVSVVGISLIFIAVLDSYRLGFYQDDILHILDQSLIQLSVVHLIN